MAFEQPISLHFPQPTELKVVLGAICNTIREPLGKDPVFYASWYELHLRPEAWGSLLVTIDREDIPAKDGLRLILQQVGMAYRVQSGNIRIVHDAYQPAPFADDPVMIAGHSLLALIAAVLGGVVAPLVADVCGRAGADGSTPAS
jgi:hypothetical protein